MVGTEAISETILEMQRWFVLNIGGGSRDNKGETAV